MLQQIRWSNLCRLLKAFTISSYFLNLVPRISFWSFYSHISGLRVGTEESQGVDVGRDLWKLSSPSPLLRAAAARAGVQALPHPALNIFEGGYSKISLGNVSQCFTAPQGKSVFLCLRGISCISGFAHCIWSCHSPLIVEKSLAHSSLLLTTTVRYLSAIIQCSVNYSL